jgi:hypothetical protein
LIGRESLEGGKIKDSKIGDGEIENDEEDIEIADYEKFFLNYAGRCAVSIHSANFIINTITI